MQEEKSEKNGEDGTRFIDRHHLIHISDLQCTEVAQPGSTGGKSGQDQKCPGYGRNTSDAVLCPDQKYHDPWKNKYNNGTDRRSYIGIGIFDTAFRQYGSQSGEQSWPKCK